MPVKPAYVFAAFAIILIILIIWFEWPVQTNPVQPMPQPTPVPVQPTPQPSPVTVQPTPVPVQPSPVTIQPMPQPTPVPVQPTPVQPVIVPNSLVSNAKATLVPGESIVSPDGKYKLTFGTDGNLFGTAILTGARFFSTNTSTTIPAVFVIQSDGNAVIYDGNTKPLWYSKGTPNAKSYTGVGPYVFTLQSDRNLVIYDSKGGVLWSSGTMI